MQILRRGGWRIVALGLHLSMVAQEIKPFPYVVQYVVQFDAPRLPFNGNGNVGTTAESRGAT